MNEFKKAIVSGLEEYLSGLYKAIEGLSEAELNWQPSLESNSIIYLLWHMGRVEDNWINKVIGGNETVWIRDGWNKKFPFNEEDYGKGYNKQDLANFPSIDKDLVNIKAELFSVDGKQRFFVEESENKKMVKDLSIKIGEKLKSESKGSYKR